MRAAVLEAPNTPLLVKDLVQDEPKYGEVKVRMGAAGICASDHHIMEGTAAFPLPSVLGHEGAGTIEAVGPGVTQLKPGDRCILSFVTPCGQCPTCRRGQPQLCDLHQATGSRLLDGTVRLHDDAGREIFQMGKLGVFGEHVVTAQQACFAIPDQVPMEVAALIGCSVTTGVGAVIHTAAVEPGSTVAVIGCGGVGLSCINGAEIAGAARIIAIDTVASKLELARKFGATDAVNAKEVDPIEAVRDMTDGGVHYSFEAIGLKATTEQAFKMIRAGGTATVIGMIPVGTMVEIHGPEFLREKKLQGSSMGSNRFRVDMPRFVDFYLDGRLHLDDMISGRIALGDVNDALQALETGEVARQVITFD